MNKYALLVLILVVGVFMDLATKTWAERSLASESMRYDHFLYRQVAASDDGISLGDWVQQTFGAKPDSEDWHRTVTRSGVVRSGEPGSADSRVELGGPAMTLSADDIVEVRQRRVEVIPGFWNHVYVRNPGAAWGIFGQRDESFRRPFFFIITILSLGLMGWLYHTTKEGQRLQMWSLSLILAGAVGNFIDRLRYGYVIDFIDWYVVWGGEERHWPTFNIADVWIFVGFVLLLIVIVKGDPKQAAETDDPAIKDDSATKSEPAASHGA